MTFLRFIMLLLTLALIGCKYTGDRQYAQAMRQLKAVNQSDFIAESTALLKSAAAKKLDDIPPDQWPPTIKKLKPVAVLNGDGVILSVILRKWVSKEEGFFIYAENYTPPVEANPPFPRRQVAPRLFWYAL